MRTERLTVLMAPAEKAAIAARAAKLGVSSGEFVRLATQNFDESELDAALEALAEELEQAMPRMQANLGSIEKSIAEARASVREALDHFESKKA